MHDIDIGSRKWSENVQKDLVDQIKRMKPLYPNIVELFESWTLRIVTALMANKATTSERAIDPGILPRKFEDNIHSVIQKDLVRSVNGKVYLTTRGCIVANDGMQRLVDNGMWPPERLE